MPSERAAEAGEFQTGGFGVRKESGRAPAEQKLAHAHTLANTRTHFLSFSSTEAWKRLCRGASAGSVRSVPLLHGRDPKLLLRAWPIGLGGPGADAEHFLLEDCAQRERRVATRHSARAHAAILMFSRWEHSRAGIAVSRAAQEQKLLTESAESGRSADFGEPSIDCREGETHVSAMYRQTTKHGSGATKERVQSLQDKRSEGTVQRPGAGGGEGWRRK